MIDYVKYDRYNAEDYEKTISITDTTAVFNGFYEGVDFKVIFEKTETPITLPSSVYYKDEDGIEHCSLNTIVLYQASTATSSISDVNITGLTAIGLFIDLNTHTYIAEETTVLHEIQPLTSTTDRTNRSR